MFFALCAKVSLEKFEAFFFLHFKDWAYGRIRLRSRVPNKKRAARNVYRTAEKRDPHLDLDPPVAV